MGRLNDATLRTWVREGNALAGKADGDGLTFCISPTGRATWALRYRYGGKPKTMTLGCYPGMSLAMARNTARERRVELSKGEDPLLVRQVKDAAVRGRKTFNDLADTYLAKEGSALANVTLEDYTRLLRLHVRPKVGRKPLDEITREEIAGLLEGIVPHSYTTAARVFSVLSVVLKHGIARGVLRENPMLGLSSRAVLGKRPPPRKRVSLDDEELREVLAALPQLGKVNALALRILLATCTRKSELTKARVEHVDLMGGRWTIPDEHAKTREGLVIPLAPMVVAWFRELIDMAKMMGTPWLIPSTAPRKHASRARLNTALQRLEANTRRFNVHDLRSTARAHLRKLGVDVIVAEKCLNHSLGGLIEIYDRGDFWEERKAALELWARHLEMLQRPRLVEVRAA